MNASTSKPAVRVPAALVAIVALLCCVLGVLALLTPSATAGYTASITNNTNTAATASYFKCTDAVAADRANALFQYALDEATNSKTATDKSPAAANGTYQGSMTTGTAAPIACPRDTGGAYVLNGSTSFVSTPKSYANPSTFTEEVWFKTTVPGGLLIGFGGNQVNTSGQHDRQVYLNTSGQLVFGAYNNAVQVVTSPKSYADGAWHHVAATLSAGTGMRLYADGQLVASNAAYTAAENYTGYFRIGYDTISGWPGTASNYYFTGSLRYAAVYSSVLSAQQIRNHYAAGQ